VAAARSGARAGYISAVGDDAFGRAFRALWAEEGVDDRTVATRADAFTGVYFITYDATGHHFSYMRKGSAASLLSAGDLPVAALRAAKLLHVSGISLAISDSACDACLAAMRIVREAGGEVQLDTNLRLRLWPLDRARAVIHGAAALATICRPSIDDARHLTGLEDPHAVLDFYLGLGSRIVALTLGADGVLVATAERRMRLAPVPCEPSDATGAGDVFGGTFATEYLRTRDAFAAARYANVAAALSTQGIGAIGPIPRRADIERRLKSLPEVSS
jgi:2-dehydro-3-deoxygluconokinase